jgi:uncharacterized phiE125 gp8 family phage protein
MSLATVTPPEAAPVSLADAKAFVRVDFSDDDVMLAELIDAATEHVEEATGRQFMPATFMMTARCFPYDGGLLRLPRSPLIEVDSVAYRDRDGAVHTLVENVDYLVDDGAVPPTIEPVVRWPDTGDYPDAVQVTFAAGYASDGGSPPYYPIPARAQVAIKALVAWWYGQAEPVSDKPAHELPYHLTRLINGLRVWRL